MTFENSATKTISLALAASFAASVALPVTAAQAHPSNYVHHHGPKKVVKHRVVKRKVIVQKHHHRHYSGRYGGRALAAGIAGLAVGAIIADSVTRPRVTYVQPRPVYVQPRPVYVAPQPVYNQPYVERRPLEPQGSGPQVIRYDDTVSASYEPWTPEWASWCNNRYRSFNQNTGTFRGYDGNDHFCVVK